MNTHKTTARFVGALFLTAMAASLLGGTVVESVLSAPDYLVAVSEDKTQLIVGVLLELVNAIAVVGIGILMFPILRPHNENMARGYFGFRTIEAVFCSAIVIGPLALMLLSQRYVQGGTVSADYVDAVGALAIAEREVIANLLILIFFCVGALLLYASLYQSGLLPRFIAVWGLIAVALVLAFNLLSLWLEVDMSVAMIFVLPIILNEITMGIWLILKGFNPSAIASGAA